MESGKPRKRERRKRSNSKSKGAKKKVSFWPIYAAGGASFSSRTDCRAKSPDAIRRPGTPAANPTTSQTIKSGASR